jgi:N-methylhydantoinase A
VRSINVPLNEADAAAMTEILAEHAAAGRAEIEAEGVPVEDIVAVHEADLLFRGQSHVFRTPLASGAFDPDATLAQFAAMYRERFDIELGGMRAMLANLRTTVFGMRPTLAMDVFAPRETVPVPHPRASREVFFSGTAFTTPLWRREDLPVGFSITGPAIIEQMDATTVLDPGASLVVDALGNLVIRFEEKLFGTSP